MLCPRDLPRLSLRLLGIAAIALLATSGVLDSVRPAAAAAAADMETWIGEAQSFYDANPERKTTKGSGWKPFNRAKWYYEARLSIDGEAPAPDARWRVWEKKQELLARQPQLRSTTSWFSLGPANYSGRVLDIEFDPTDVDIIYVGSASGGLWKSTDAGASFVPMSDELPSIAIGAVAVLPWAPNVVLIGTGEGANGDVTGVGVLKSTDGGTTWNTTGMTYPVTSGHGFHVMEVNPTTQTILAGATDGLWRSTDEGETWVDVKTGGDYFDVKWKPGDPMRVYTVKGSDASGNNVKVSTDDGLTWTKAGTGQPVSFAIGKSKIAVTAAAPATIYALYSENSISGNTTGVYRSTDDGATWTAQNTTTNIAGGQGWYNLSLAVDPNNANVVIAGGVNLFRSVNAGVSYSQISGFNAPHVDHHAIQYVPGSNSEVWVGSDGGCWRSTNDGDSWIDMNNGLVTYQFYDICVNNNPDTPYYAMGGTQDQGTDKWAGTSSWLDGLFADGMVCNINPVNGTAVYAEIQFGQQYKNLSSGVGGWTPINNGFTGGKAWVTPVDQDQTAGAHLYTASSDGIFRTTSGGSSWTNVASHAASWICFSPLDGDMIWTVQGAGAPYLTTDDGATWTQVSPYGFTVSGSATKILAHPTDPDGVFVVFGSYLGTVHVVRSTDRGATWEDVTGDFPSQPVNAIEVDPAFPTDWYIGTDVGIWKSTNGGVNWLPFDTDLPNVVVSDLEIQIHERKLVAGTYGRGLWELDLPPVGGVGVETTLDARPGHLMFDAPWPNPVQDRTLLRYAARSDGRVTLDVYDVTGRHVINLVDRDRGDGLIRTTPWFPDSAPNGVYFAVLRADGEKITRKMVVTR
jgi:hypothetical protein